MFLLSISLHDALFIALCFVVHLVYRTRKRTLFPFPPGPFRWPIIGNALTIPFTNAHVFYKNLGTTLGTKIIYMEALGRSIIILNDIKMAQDLLEKRSALYSSRPQMPMFNDVIGFDQRVFAFMSYGDIWRAHRRLFQQHFSEKHLPRLEEKELEFVRKILLPNLLSTPGKFRDHIWNCVGGLSISATYGLPVQRQDDPLVKYAARTFSESVDISAPGKYLVEVIPQLKYIPEWMPGAGFKRRAKEVRELLDRVLEEPYQLTLKAMEDGTAPQSFVFDALEHSRGREDFELQALFIKQTAMQVFGAMAETTVASVMTFILAMLLHPHIQRKVQEELDSLVGTDRLPDFSDILKLSYLSAVVKETLRWNPIVPLGVPHATSNEDVYMGYYIPKDCMVAANTFAILHDESIFPDPTEFKPERFLQDGVLRKDLPDPEVFATFGFGRRICPGSHIARSLLRIIAASVLQLFDISPPLDSRGRPIKVEPRFPEASLVSVPLPFECKMIPRTGRNAKNLLREYLGNDPV